MATINMEHMNPSNVMNSMPKWGDLPAFNLKDALAGKPYIHYADAMHRGFASDVIYSKVRVIDDKEDPCILVWAGEWCVYDNEEHAQQQLRMYVRK